jgi:hypothetical protein
MKDIKTVLTQIVNYLETIATNQGAMEAALAERGVISSDDIDMYTGVLSAPHTNAKHGLATVRYQISQLPD